MKQSKYANTPRCPIAEDYKERFLLFNNYVGEHGDGSTAPNPAAPHWTQLPELPAFIQSRWRLAIQPITITVPLPALPST